MDYRGSFEVKKGKNHLFLLPRAQASDTGHFSCILCAYVDEFSVQLFKSPLLMDEVHYLTDGKAHFG